MPSDRRETPLVLWITSYISELAKATFKNVLERLGLHNLYQPQSIEGDTSSCQNIWLTYAVVPKVIVEFNIVHYPGAQLHAVASL